MRKQALAYRLMAEECGHPDARLYTAIKDCVVLGTAQFCHWIHGRSPVYTTWDNKRETLSPKVERFSDPNTRHFEHPFIWISTGYIYLPHLVELDSISEAFRHQKFEEIIPIYTFACTGYAHDTSGETWKKWRKMWFLLYEGGDWRLADRRNQKIAAFIDQVHTEAVFNRLD